MMRDDSHALTGFWFNPNIHPADEHTSRLDSMKTLADKWCIEMLYDEGYKPHEYFDLFRCDESYGKDSIAIPPFPERCKSCYAMRLEKTAEEAQKQGFDSFTTTLLISPYQDFEQLTSTGRELEDRYNVEFYHKDFRPYFRDAMALSKELGLYRQKYCGCFLSEQERYSRKKKK
jgi:predicted adenine nucleotide alpha hydrolase (AANH) superfamily ATPase